MTAATVTALGIARPGGAVGHVGVLQESTGPDALPVFLKNVSIVGGPAPARAYIEGLLADVLEGRSAPGRGFDRITSLDGRADGYRALDTPEAIKVMLEF